MNAFFSFVPTTFWWDNLDKNIDKKIGGESLHITSRVFFFKRMLRMQYITREKHYNKNRTVCWLIYCTKILLEKILYISTTRKILQGLQPVRYDSTQNFRILLYLRKILRYTSLDKRRYSKFRDFIVKLHSKQRTATWNHAQEITWCCQKDKYEICSHNTWRSAAIKAYHLIWNYQEK